MKTIVKSVFAATVLVAGVAQAASFSESGYPFDPAATSPVVDVQKAPSIAKESAGPRFIMNNTKTHEEVMQELAEYNSAHPDEFISY